MQHNAVVSYHIVLVHVIIIFVPVLILIPRVPRPSSCTLILRSHVNRRTNPTLDTFSILLPLDLLFPLPPPHHLTSQAAKVPPSLMSLTQASQTLRALCSHSQQITALSFPKSRE